MFYKSTQNSCRFIFCQSRNQFIFAALLCAHTICNSVNTCTLAYMMHINTTNILLSSDCISIWHHTPTNAFKWLMAQTVAYLNSWLLNASSILLCSLQLHRLPRFPLELHHYFCKKPIFSLHLVQIITTIELHLKAITYVRAQAARLKLEHLSPMAKRELVEPKPKEEMPLLHNSNVSPW